MCVYFFFYDLVKDTAEVYQRGMWAESVESAPRWLDDNGTVIIGGYIFINFFINTNLVIREPNLGLYCTF